METAFLSAISATPGATLPVTALPVMVVMFSTTELVLLILILALEVPILSVALGQEPPALNVLREPISTLSESALQSVTNAKPGIPRTVSVLLATVDILSILPAHALDHQS